MKDYFKKSHIYKKFEAEKIKEKLEDEEATKVDTKMDAMQSKYMDLMKKYGFVLAQVNKQNEIAQHLEEMSKKMPKEDLIMIPEDKTSTAQANTTVSANKTVNAQVNKTLAANITKTAVVQSNISVSSNKTEASAPKTAAVQVNSTKKANASAPISKVLLQLSEEHSEYPSPSVRGPIPENAHSDHEYSHLVNNEPIKVYGDEDYWRNSPYIPHYFSSTGVEHSREIEVLGQRGEYPSPDIRGPVPENAHPDSTFSSHLHNDWTH